MKAVLIGLVLAATVALIAPPPASGAGAKPCKRATFETELVEKACAAGGQPAAKQAMKDFVKKAKAAAGGDPDLTCDTCHEDLAPDYPLTKDALARFKKLSALVK